MPDVGGVPDEQLRAATKALRVEAFGDMGQEDFAREVLVTVRTPTLRKYENIRACGKLPVLWHMGRLAEQRGRPDLASVFRRAVFGEFAAQLGEGVPVTEIVEVAGTLREIQKAVAWEPKLARELADFIKWRRGADQEDLHRIAQEFARRRECD